ncbi:MAG: phosphatidate cytidylyltransferase [Janthinobacterium lividum]
MLRTRIITAVVLLAVLLAIVLAGSPMAFALALCVFFAAAAWESFRLFKTGFPIVGAVIWTVALAVILLRHEVQRAPWLFGLCVAIWVLRLAPALKFGLPALDTLSNRLLSAQYGVTLLASFVGMMLLFTHSALYLLSVLALVWIADIGAYFSGKAFGKNKLAPSISPGKSWEGAIGGWLAVMVIGLAVSMTPALADSFPAYVRLKWGGAGLFAVLSLITVASVVGDLFESMLKRRAGFKDSSNLLPGHGGVLDRIDALIPVLPLAVFVDAWL